MIQTVLAWVHAQAPRPPAMPAIPDFRAFGLPKSARLIPGFANAWNEALVQIQGRVDGFAHALWSAATALIPQAFQLGVFWGIGIGVVIGFFAGCAFYRNLTQTLAHRDQLTK